jgi:hypothetical protein
MSKVKLIFNLPSEFYEFESDIKGEKYRSAILEILELFRRKLKYEDISNEEYGLLESVRTEILNDIISDLPIE